MMPPSRTAPNDVGRACMLPTDSSTASAPWPPVSFLTSSAPSSPEARTMSVAPNPAPRSVRSACRPIRTICPAPRRLAASNSAQPHRAVADDRDAHAGPDLRGDGGVVAGAEHVGESHQRRQQRRVRRDRQLHQRPGGLRDPHGLALAAVHAVEAVAAAVRAGGLQAAGAPAAGVVGVGERREYQVAALEPGDLGACVLDDAEELMSHLPPLVCGWHGPVGVQVAAADRGAYHAYDRVGRGVDRWVGYVFDADVTGSVHQRRLHVIKPTTAGTGVSTVRGTLMGSLRPLP